MTDALMAQALGGKSDGASSGGVGREKSTPDAPTVWACLREFCD
jgi:hypothetical protein